MLLQLRSYAEAFLGGSYNLLLGSLRKDLEPGLNISRLAAQDFLRFFRLAAFFTAFVRMQQARAPARTLSFLSAHQPFQRGSPDTLPACKLCTGEPAEAAAEGGGRRSAGGVAVLLHISDHGLGDVPPGAVAVAQHHRPPGGRASG